MRKLVCVVLFAACSSAPKPAAAPPETPPAATAAGPAASRPAPRAAGPAATAKVMTGDTPWADLDGNTFIVPDGWTVETFPAMTLVSPPEGDSHLAVIDVSADSNDAARDAAWKVYKPDATWPLLAT